MRAVGAKGFPSSVLIDSSGTIVFAGHPAKVTSEMVTNATAGALPIGLYDWPDDLKKAAKTLRKGDYEGTLAAINKEGPDFTTYADAIRAVVAGKIKALDAAIGSGDWLRVETMAKGLKDQLGKLPEAEEVKTALDNLKADKEAQAILKAQKRIAKVFEKKINKSKASKLKDSVRKIAKDYPGTVVERDADRAVKRLDEIRQGR